MSLLLLRGRGLFSNDSGTGDTYRDTVVADGPVAYWRLGESSGSTAVDEMGAHDATYNNSPTLGTTGALANSSDTAATFVRSSSQWVEASDHADLDFTGDFSVEFWMKQAFSAFFHIIVAKSDSAADRGWLIYTASSGNVVKFDGRDGTATYHANDGTVNVEDDQWHHVVCVREGSNWKIFVDGALDISNSKGTGSMANSQPLTIGRRYVDGPEYYEGDLDEVAVYNYALSATKILNHYEIGAGV